MSSWTVEGVVEKSGTRWVIRRTGGDAAPEEVGEVVPIVRSAVEKALDDRRRKKELFSGECRIRARLSIPPVGGDPVVDHVEIVEEQRVNVYTHLPFRSAAEAITEPPHRTSPPKGLLSGRVLVKLEVVTPVAVYGTEERAQATHKVKGTGGELERLQKESDRYTVVSLPRHDGGVVIPGAGIKGVIRSWYEAITRSVRLVKGGRWGTADPLAGKLPVRLDEIGDRFHPADVVFGPAQQEQGHRQAWAGRVRVSSARPVTDGPKVKARMFKLPRLDGPKPSSAGLYLERRAGKAGEVDWEAADVRVRGTKVYWHTPGRVVSVDEKIEDAREVEAIESGTFELTLDFEDLSAEQLGGLLLACSLRFDPRCGRRHGWKLGYAKPLGYGSVVNTVAKVLLLDEPKSARDPFAPLAPTECSDWEQEWVQPIRADLKGLKGEDERLAEYLEAAADLDTLGDHIEVDYVGLGEIHAPAKGKRLSQPDALEVAEGVSLRITGR